MLEKKPRPATEPGASDKEGDEQEGDDEVLSEVSEELDYEDDEEGEDDDDDGGDGDGDSSSGGGDSGPESDQEQAIPPEAAEAAHPRRERKRKRKDDNEGLEANYLAELTDDAPEPSGKRLKSQQESDDGDDGDVPMHETLAHDADASEVEKAARTVFLSNVSTDAISSKQAKKTLVSHLLSVLDPNDARPQKLESIRFRSVAFSTAAMPKRAAYITKSLMSATTKSANAYAVFSSPAAARKVIADLNGTEVLGRHLRADSVAHPSPKDHRRCVFVGNLGFVDDETVVSTDAQGNAVEKKRSKVPADVEEGLWRTFGKQARVESVRVVRDSKTRVGKGIAYVQFYDANDVEAALLLDGKKFPPMLPRPLRVTRAKNPRKTAMALERANANAAASSGAAARSPKYTPKATLKATPEGQAAAGRAGKLLGRAVAARLRTKARADDAHGIKTPKQIVFEGRRASAKDGYPKDLKLVKKSAGKGGKPKTRSTRRAAEWKKSSANSS